MADLWIQCPCAKAECEAVLADRNALREDRARLGAELEEARENRDEWKAAAIGEEETRRNAQERVRKLEAVVEAAKDIVQAEARARGVDMSGKTRLPPSWRPLLDALASLTTPAAEEK